MESDGGIRSVFGWVDGGGSDEGTDIASLGEEDLGSGITVPRESRLGTVLGGVTAPLG
jgi:hypothetical protein